jgi:hypothetical protein
MGKTEPITNSVRKTQNTVKGKNASKGVKKKREGPKEKSSLPKTNTKNGLRRLYLQEEKENQKMGQYIAFPFISLFGFHYIGLSLPV